MCIDVCPVGALTSGSYRYKTRPWEMKHVSTVCTHCGDGCKVTLGVRQANEGSEIVRADNRDKSGINGDFLCAKGRFGFDFVENPERLTKPLVRNAAGKLEPTTWEHAFRVAGGEAEGDSRQPGRRCDRRDRIESDHQRRELSAAEVRAHGAAAPTTLITSAPPNMRRLRARWPAARARRRACATWERRRPFCWWAAIPRNEHPLLAWQIRTNVRLNRARLYIANHRSIKLERQAKAVQGVPPAGYRDLTTILDQNESDFAKAVMAEESLLVIFGQEFRGDQVECVCELGTEARQCALRVPGRSRQFARRGGHGTAAGSASRVCAGGRAWCICRGICGDAGNAGTDTARDDGSRA